MHMLPNVQASLISHASKVMLKVFKLGFSNKWTENFQMYKLGLEKAEEPMIKLPTSQKAREFQKTVCFCFIDYTNPLTMCVTTNWGIFLKRWEYKITLPASWEICIQVKKQQ